MKFKKRKMSSAKDASVKEVPSAKSIKPGAMSAMAKLRSAKSSKSAKSAASDKKVSAKEVNLPDIEGTKDGKFKKEYLERIKKRLMSTK